jgi:hypothetical protein
MILDPEDEAFNEIERKAKQRKEAVKAAIEAEKAFPNPHRTDITDMTLRDYFAARGLEALMHKVTSELESKHYSIDKAQKIQKVYASICYSMADAMLEARET